jgi:hypothetical protein
MFGFAVGTFGLLPAPVRASCALPPVAVVWSYPEDGATGVPTNAHLWILISTPDYLGDVTVNGMAAPAGRWPFERLPSLERDTDYDVAITAGEPPFVSLHVHFRTGAAPGQARDLKPDPGAALTFPTSRDLSATCSRAEALEGCFDTGPPTREQVDVAGQALAFVLVPQSFDLVSPNTGKHIVESRPARLWPASCGAPGILDYPHGCLDVFAVDEVGSSAHSGPVCPPQPDAGVDAGHARAPMASHGGCSIARFDTAAGSDVIALLLGLLVIRLRSRNALALASAALCVLLTACGDDDDRADDSGVNRMDATIGRGASPGTDASPGADASRGTDASHSIDAAADAGKNADSATRANVDGGARCSYEPFPLFNDMFEPGERYCAARVPLSECSKYPQLESLRCPQSLAEFTADLSCDYSSEDGGLDENDAGESIYRMRSEGCGSVQFLVRYEHLLNYYNFDRQTGALIGWSSYDNDVGWRPPGCDCDYLEGTTVAGVLRASCADEVVTYCRSR